MTYGPWLAVHIIELKNPSSNEATYHSFALYFGSIENKAD
jgi:hypothetical protein